MISRFLFLGLVLTSLACGGGANLYQGMDPLSIYQIASEEYEVGEYDNAIQALELDGRVWDPGLDDPKDIK